MPAKKSDPSKAVEAFTGDDASRKNHSAAEHDQPQHRLPFGGQTLFSDNFLAERLPAHPCWTDDDLPELHRRLVDAYHTFREVRKDQEVQPLSGKHESTRTQK